LELKVASTSTSTLDFYSSTTRVQVQVPSTTSLVMLSTVLAFNDTVCSSQSHVMCVANY